MKINISTPLLRLTLTFAMFIAMPFITYDGCPSVVCAQTKKKTTTKSSTTTKKATTTKTTTKAKTTSKSTSTAKKTTTAKQTVVLSEKAKLQKEQANTKKLRAQSQQREKNINRSIRSNLDSVVIINNEIHQQQLFIDSLNRTIKTVAHRIDTLYKEIEQLRQDLIDKKAKFTKSMQYLQRNRNPQEELMFIFSAKNLSQVLRRLRYAREYSSYQVVQGKMIKQQQKAMQIKQNDLLNMKTQLVLDKVAVNKRQQELEEMRLRCQQKVEYLNLNLVQVQNQIQQYKEKEAELDKQIEEAIQKEIEEARRIAAEKKAKEEAARKAAEAERKEKERLLAEAKAAREKAEAAKKAAAERMATAQKAKDEATNSADKKDAKKEISTLKSEIKAAEKEMKKADAEIKKADDAVKAATKTENAEKAKIDAWVANDSDTKLTSGFVNNKGRLPMPITGKYVIVRHFGTYTVQGLKAVTLDNKGIDIKGQEGAMARAAFDGEVSSIFQYGSSYIVMLRHGSYITVYSGLSSVSVSKGQKVSTKQNLGKVGKNSDGDLVLHFQLRKESTRLNPEQWVN